MGHRAKHLRRNWVPGRLKAAEERAKAEEKRQRYASAAKAKALTDAVEQRTPSGTAG